MSGNCLSTTFGKVKRVRIFNVAKLQRRSLMLKNGRNIPDARSQKRYMPSQKCSSTDKVSPFLDFRIGNPESSREGKTPCHQSINTDLKQILFVHLWVACCCRARYFKTPNCLEDMLIGRFPKNVRLSENICSLDKKFWPNLDVTVSGLYKWTNRW